MRHELTQSAVEQDRLAKSSRDGMITQRTGREIAIIGMSGRFPGGANSPDSLWQVLRAGIDAVGEVQGDRWDLGWHHPDPGRNERVYTRAGGFLDRIDAFDAEFFGISPKEARQVDPQHRLLLELAWEAFEDASLPPRQQGGTETGVFIGISGNDYAHLVGPQAPDAYSNTGSSTSIAANRISYIFDLHGPSVALDTACSSSLVCVHQACISLLTGECSTALAGGVNLLINVRPWIGFSKASMLSPSGRCKSFDASGDGYVRSEGGGLVVLKPLAAAERDGDRILGVILASGVNSDGRTLGLSMPNGEAQESLLRKVYAQCGVAPEEVFYVEAHGTGTSVGDPIECGALGRVLGSPRTDGSRCLIGSVKSNIGHLEAASGIAGLTKVLLSLKHREIPANLHFVDPNPKIDFEGWKLDVVAEAAPVVFRERPTIIGVNSFGFGGTNAHLVIQEYRAPHASSGNERAHVRATDFQRVLVLSGHSQSALLAVVRSYVDLLRSSSSPGWEDICAGAATTRSPQRYRLAVAAKTTDEAAERLEQYLAGKQISRLATGSAALPVEPLAFVYSGNGPQWWGMGRELLAENQVFRDEIETIDRIFAPLAGWSLIEEMGRPESDTRIALTEFAQPLLFALQLGLTRLLHEAGAVPMAVTGHSVGEVAAAYVSGALTLDQATRVIFYRSKAQARTAGRGRMAALGVSADEALEVMQSVDGWLEIAAENAPESVTVAGDPVALEKMIQALTAKGKFARLLQLNYPFHTRAMEFIKEELLDGLAGLKSVETKTPFISTVTGKTIPGTELGAEYWYRNVREPVQFRNAINSLLEEHGVGVFLEIGPHPVLKDYIQQITKAAGSASVSLQTLRRPGVRGAELEVENLWTSICACHAYGAIDPSLIFIKPVPPPVLPLYPWQKTSHWRGNIILPDIYQPTHRDHPLLGYRLTTGDGIWENTLDTNQIPYLKDHVIQGAVLFPAAGYIELALAAAQKMYSAGAIDIDDLDISRPLAIPSHGDPMVQTSVDAAVGAFEIRSRADHYSSDWLPFVRGRVSRSESPDKGESIDITQIVSRLPCQMSFEEHYLATAGRGLCYGPAFQGIVKILMSSPEAPIQEALAIANLPELNQEVLSPYRAHPALLDSSLQALVSLVGRREKRSCAILPVHFQRIRSIAPLPDSIVCHIVITQETDRSVVADSKLMDSQGNLLLVIDKIRCAKVDFGQGTASPLISEWWRLDSGALLPVALPALPAPSKIHETLKAELNHLSEGNRRAVFYKEILPQLNRLIAAFITHTLDSLHSDKSEFDQVSFARAAGVGSQQTKLLHRVLEIASALGVIIPVEDLWKRSDDIAVEPEVLWRSLLYRYPGYQTELMIIAQICSDLPAVLRGELPDFTTTSFEQLFDTAPFQLTYNQIARAAVAALVQSWPQGRPLRILEIGGAGGALTSWLLPILPELLTDYLFTDSSDAAIGRTEYRFEDRKFIRFSTLDFESDFVEQGLPENYFDLVIAGNVLYSGLDIDLLLTRLKRVMAPDGQLLALCVHQNPLTELLLIERPPTGQLWDVAQYSKALGKAGLKEIVALSDAAYAGGGETLQSVLLAQRKDHSSTIETTSDVTPIRRNDTHQWVIFVEDNESTESRIFNRKLVESIQSCGDDVSLDVYDAEPAVAKIAKVYGQAGAYSVVYISSASAVEERGEDLLIKQQRRCMAALDIVRSLETGRQLNGNLQLKLVVRGAFSNAFGHGPADPGQAALWGIGRVVTNEHPGLGCRLIDLNSESSSPEEAAAALAVELLRRDDETEVQLVAGYRFVNRERLMSMTDEARNTPAPTKDRIEGFKLDFIPQGGLDSLYLRSIERAAPRENQVEIAIRYAGLNFRDVLWSMGMLPEEAVEEGFSGPTIGMECAGEIVQIGSGVTRLKIGDRVVAFASSCFASHVTTEASSVNRIPDNIGFAEAATIPTAFLTAYYALGHLANLAQGESVLIHGAAGGVGLAAIQIAKLKGAKIFGTAGSERKRRALQMLGVDHVLNSRSLDFADEVMELTGGVGVDVVLNSLAGEAITRSLKCLKPFGRFLEIGKRDLYANTHIGLRPFRKNLSYFAIDADTLLVERRELARSLFKEIMELVAANELRPLPFESIPVSRASEAFRAMQQSRHIGKLVLSMESDIPDSLPVVYTQQSVKPARTYIVTGGLGGFGLATAKWLVEQGATSLALIGRRGAVTEEAIAGIAELEQAGATVKAFATDISNPQSLSVTLDSIRATMKPIVGIIHSAAVIEDAPLMQITDSQLIRVFESKICGAWNLHQATLQDSIDMFVLYSSSSAVIGNPGQGAYVAGNLYLDALAQYRRSLGLAGLAIGWGAIKDAGFLTRHSNVADMLRTRTGLDATPSREALRDLGRLNSVGATRVCVARFDLQRIGRILPGTLVPRFSSIITPAAASALHAEESLADKLKTTPASERRSLLITRIQEHAAKVLGAGAAQIDVEQPLAEIGLDSLMAVELAVAIERDLGHPMSVMQLLSAGNITSIAELAIRMLGGERHKPVATETLNEVELSGSRA